MDFKRNDLILEGLAYTVMGILVVFMILVIIMAVIKAMALISGEKKPKSKQDSLTDATVKKETQADEAPETVQDDGELVAVITAAIVAMMGQAASGLIVRSYKKIDGDAWNKAGRMDVLDNRL